MSSTPKNFSYSTLKDVYPTEQINYTVPVFRSAPGVVGYQRYFNPTNPSMAISPTITGLGNNIQEFKALQATGAILRGPYEECIGGTYNRNNKSFTKKTPKEAHNCCVDQCGKIPANFADARKMCEDDCDDGMKRWV